MRLWLFVAKVTSMVDTLADRLLRPWIYVALGVLTVAALALDGAAPAVSVVAVLVTALLITLWFLRRSMQKDREGGWLP